MNKWSLSLHPRSQADFGIFFYLDGWHHTHPSSLKSETWISFQKFQSLLTHHCLPLSNSHQFQLVAQICLPSPFLCHFVLGLRPPSCIPGVPNVLPASVFNHPSLMSTEARVVFLKSRSDPAAFLWKALHWFWWATGSSLSSLAGHVRDSSAHTWCLSCPRQTAECAMQFFDPLLQLSS